MADGFSKGLAEIFDHRLSEPKRSGAPWREYQAREAQLRLSSVFPSAMLVH